MVQVAAYNECRWFAQFRRQKMPAAVGMVEVKGLPPALAVADAMVKAARVTLVGYEKVSSARYTIIVRGDVAEVQTSVSAGVDSVRQVNTEEELLLSYHVIARPHENVETVLPIDYRQSVEQFRV
jgi:carbon dioxide concentrating mechanism protein CcmK